MVEIINDLYHAFDQADDWYKTKIIDEFIEEENQVFDKWKKCFDAFMPKVVTSETAAIAKMNSLCYSDFIDNLNRNDLSLGNDLKAIYNNKPKFKVIYTDEDTFLTKDEKNFVLVKSKKEESETPLFVFEGE
jgi:hypothetical protein